MILIQPLNFCRSGNRIPGGGSSSLIVSELRPVSVPPFQKSLPKLLPPHHAGNPELEEEQSHREEKGQEKRGSEEMGEKRQGKRQQRVKENGT